MCEFHLKGQCFHPDKATKGLVATQCTFHDCSDCTSKKWQASMVEENYSYYQSIVKITQAQQRDPVSSEKKSLMTKIFSAKN